MSKLVNDTILAQEIKKEVPFKIEIMRYSTLKTLKVVIVITLLVGVIITGFAVHILETIAALTR